MQADEGWSVRIRQPAVVHVRNDLRALSDEVGLGEAVERRTGGGPPGLDVVMPERRCTSVTHGAYSDHIRTVAWNRNRVREGPGIPGGCNDDDSRLPCLCHRLIERIDEIRNRCVSAETEIQNAHVVFRLVRHHPLNAFDDHVIWGSAAAVEYARAEHLRFWRNSKVNTGGIFL